MLYDNLLKKLSRDRAPLDWFAKTRESHFSVLHFSTLFCPHFSHCIFGILHLIAPYTLLHLSYSPQQNRGVTWVLECPSKPRQCAWVDRKQFNMASTSNLRSQTTSILNESNILGAKLPLCFTAVFANDSDTETNL